MNNYPVVIINSLYETVPETVNRTWKERLFTFPWNPFRLTKIIYTQKPAAYKYDGIIYANPHRVTDIYSIFHNEENAPTLKVKAVR
jgi:hypothetical protein